MRWEVSQLSLLSLRGYPGAVCSLKRQPDVSASGADSSSEQKARNGQGLAISKLIRSENKV